MLAGVPHIPVPWVGIATWQGAAGGKRGKASGFRLDTGECIVSRS